MHETIPLPLHFTLPPAHARLHIFPSSPFTGDLSRKLFSSLSLMAHPGEHASERDVGIAHVTQKDLRYRTYPT